MQAMVRKCSLHVNKNALKVRKFVHLGPIPENYRETVLLFPEFLKNNFSIPAFV